MLVDGADGAGGNFQFHPSTRLRHEELLLLQVRQETALRFAIRVGNRVPRNRTLACQFTNFRHDSIGDLVNGEW